METQPFRTDQIRAVIATSGPSGTYPQRAYRNPLDALVNFLDSKHGANWCIWEFRAEGTGYPDSEVYGRIHHFPWPDHHPPPFALIPNIMGSMRNWLEEKDVDGPGKRVAVVHCKAGKGRSGTIASGYLISQEGWKKEDALQRFTERRMRVGFGNGVSIPSQLRYVGYIDRWANQLQKEYVERPVEVVEVHTWGLRDGVNVAVRGFEDEGKKTETFHLFHRKERTVVAEGNPSSSDGDQDRDKNRAVKSTKTAPVPSSATLSRSKPDTSSSASATDLTRRSTISSNRNLSAVIFRPSKRVIIPGSDVKIGFERRSKASYTGFAMVTSVAHVWFNAYFEGGNEHDSGVFEVEWDAMDGIKGSVKKGIRAFERLKVVWRYAPPSSPTPAEQDATKDTAATSGRPISQPKPGEPVHESVPADWRGSEEQNRSEDQLSRTEIEQGQENLPPTKKADAHKPTSAGIGGTGNTISGVGAGSLHELEKQLGLRKQTDESNDVGSAGSEIETPATTDDEGRARTVRAEQEQEENGDLEGVRPYFGRNGDGNGNGEGGE